MELKTLLILIIGFMMGGFLIGYYVCRERFNRIESGLEALGNNIIFAERNRREEAERYSANHQARFTGGDIPSPPLEVSAPPPPFTATATAEVTEIRILWEQLYGGNKKEEEPKPATKPESKREHKRRIQLE
jgi:hypothetical protein